MAVWTLGIGVSGQRDTVVEFEALEIPVNTRGRRTDEMLDVMKQLWTGESVSHHGRFFNFDDITLLPKPMQEPHPPIWVAGRSDAALRRAAIDGDGWYPYLFTGEPYPPFQSERQRYGRAIGPRPE